MKYHSTAVILEDSFFSFIDVFFASEGRLYTIYLTSLQYTK